MPDAAAAGANTQALGGGFGGILGGFIIDEVQNRGGILLTSMEITMITVLSGLAVALWVKDKYRAILEGQVESLKNRLDVVTSGTGTGNGNHAPYNQAGETVAIAAAPPPLPGAA